MSNVAEVNRTRSTDWPYSERVMSLLRAAVRQPNRTAANAPGAAREGRI